MNMLLPRAPVPSQTDRDREHAKHDHRLDITPEMIAADPWFLERPVTFLTELAETYQDPEAALTRWALAAEVQL